MKLIDIFGSDDQELELDEECEVLYFDADGNEILDEGVVRQFKKQGDKIVRKFRCLTGPKAGKLVSHPSSCGKRKDPKNVKKGKKVMRQKGGIIRRKGQVSKRKAIAKQLAKVNKRLSQ